MSAQSTSSGGVSFCGLLFLLFLALKLTGYINWSWWWVTAPLWMPWAVAIPILIVVFIVWSAKEGR